MGWREWWVRRLAASSLRRKARWIGEDRRERTTGHDRRFRASGGRHRPRQRSLSRERGLVDPQLPLPLQAWLPRSSNPCAARDMSRGEPREGRDRHNARAALPAARAAPVTARVRRYAPHVTIHAWRWGGPGRTRRFGGRVSPDQRLLALVLAFLLRSGLRERGSVCACAAVWCGGAAGFQMMSDGWISADRIRARRLLERCDARRVARWWARLRHWGSAAARVNGSPSDEVGVPFPTRPHDKELLECVTLCSQNPNSAKPGDASR